MISNALYIRGERVGTIKGGADIVSKSILTMLERYFDGNVEELYIRELRGSIPSRLDILKSAIHGHFEPYNPAVRDLMLRHLDGVSFAFIDQSVYGRALEDIKSRYENIKTAILFHNLEKHYYLQRILHLGRLHNAILVPAVARAEKAAVKSADCIISVSPRDAAKIQAVYGRTPDMILLPPIQDRFPGSNPSDMPIRSPSEFTMLFAGSAFPPNLKGMRWFVRNIMPNLQGKLIIVGHGFEEYQSELSRGNVRVIGSVEDLAPWYAIAHCIVSPIFWGQGIKVKTAEAYMYGKTVVGTEEAFAGYDYRKAGSILARTRADFIEALRALCNHARLSAGLYNKQARRYYEEEISFEAQYRKFARTLERVLS